MNRRRITTGLRSLTTLAACVAPAACAGSQPKAEVATTPTPQSPQVQGEQLVWSSHQSRPSWTVSEPDADAEHIYFVGVSGDFATENLARDDAMRNCTNHVVSYLGTLAKDKFERARTSFGLASSVVDPTEASRQFEKQLAANVAKQLKPKEWYLERWVRTDGNSWKAFSLARMPRAVVEADLKNTAEDNMKQAQAQAKAAATESAKKQAEDAAEFWRKMKEEGLME